MNFNWNPEKATLILPITKPEIESRIVEYAHDHGYFEKPEFHITIISFQNGKKIIQACQGININQIVDLANTFSWEVELVPEYYVLERTIKEFVLHGKIQTPAHTRRSIIQKVLLPDIVPFFKELDRLTGQMIEVPPMHVTLFSWSDYEPEQLSGIALNSQADFESYFKEKI